MDGLEPPFAKASGGAAIDPINGQLVGMDGLEPSTPAL